MTTWKPNVTPAKARRWATQTIRDTRGIALHMKDGVTKRQWLLYAARLEALLHDTRALAAQERRRG